MANPKVKRLRRKVQNLRSQLKEQKGFDYTEADTTTTSTLGAQGKAYKYRRVKRSGYLAGQTSKKKQDDTLAGKKLGAKRGGGKKK